MSRHPRHSVRRPVMYQGWDTFGALHWSYEPAAVQHLLPPGLTVDTFDGAAWVGITPFLMSGVRLPGLPPVPGLSTFPETNVRTFVRDARGRDGLWFLTLEAANLPFVCAARATLGVPYAWADMAVERTESTVRYRSRRRFPRPRDACSDIVLQPGGPLPDATRSELDDFLTGRWRGFVPTPVGMHFVPIEHEPWPLRRAAVEAMDETLLAACGLGPPPGDPVVHYSPGVHVRLGPPVPAA